MSLAQVERPQKQRDALAALRISRTPEPRRSRGGFRWLIRLFVVAVMLGVVAGGLYVADSRGMLNVQQLVEKVQPRLEVRVAK